jgi:hypothetical protein
MQKSRSRGRVAVRNQMEVRLLIRPPNFKREAMPKYAYQITHGRRQRRNYLAGETVPRYGIAIQQPDKNYIFLNASSGWGQAASVWRDPPYHYFNDQYGKPRFHGAFIVNFRKKNAPQPECFLY